MHPWTRLVVVAGTLLLIGQAANATTSDSVIDINGHPDCNRLTTDPNILQAQDKNPPSRGGPGTAVGEDGQVFNYEIDAFRNVLDWNTTGAPVNFSSSSYAPCPIYAVYSIPTGRPYHTAHVGKSQ